MAHAPVRRPSSRVLDAVAISLAIGICVGLAWPGDVDPPKAAETLRAGQLVEATVDSIEIVPCGTTTGGASGGPAQGPAGPSCRRITFLVEDGKDAGSTPAIEMPDVSTTPDLQPGELVILERPPVEIPGMPYGFYDRIRTPPLMWLAVIFAALVVLLGRMRGFAALVGLAASIAVLLVFVIPAILKGSSPVVVASVGAGAIGFIVLYIAHGFTSRTTVALIGTLTGVGVTLVLSLIWRRSPTSRVSSRSRPTSCRRSASRSTSVASCSPAS